MDAQILSIPSLFLLYLYYWFAGTEESFCLYLIYNFSRIVLITIDMGFVIDVVILEYDYHLFCKFQAVEDPKTCKTRNEYILTTALLFWFIVTPFWYACNNSIYAFARDANFFYI